MPRFPNGGILVLRFLFVLPDFTPSAHIVSISTPRIAKPLNLSCMSIIAHYRGDIFINDKVTAIIG